MALKFFLFFIFFIVSYYVLSPCFDEPNLKATYNIKIKHPLGTFVLSNSEINRIIELGQQLQTEFDTTPKLPTYLIGLTIFNQSDFKYIQNFSQSNRKVRNEKEDKRVF